jgi:hypothetical protein
MGLDRGPAKIGSDGPYAARAVATDSDVVSNGLAPSRATGILASDFIVGEATSRQHHRAVSGTDVPVLLPVGWSSSRHPQTLTEPTGTLPQSPMRVHSPAMTSRSLQDEGSL